MTKRMLIDDTQAEETRVVIVNGNKVEDVELESSFRKQIKGNIYLAKVMRIEPSLQAAFVDYGGNKHGFLAFGEIHPDYYNVSDDIINEIDKEVDEAIEAKKQYLRERELERERYREEKARERARIEEERRLAEEHALVKENDQEEKSEELENLVNTEVANEVVALEATESSSEVVSPIKNSDASVKENSENIANVAKKNSEENTINDIEEKATEATTEVEDEKHKRKKRILKKRIKKQKEQQSSDDVADDKNSLKVMSAEIVTDEVIKEDVIADDANIIANSDDVENDNDDIDDDDNEYDFEIQRKLMKLRKLFHRSTIQDVIKEGQVLLVQVVKEERGNKGAALTTYLSLAGRYCVLMPNRIKSGGVSRKITNVADRKRLKSIVKELPIRCDMSMIVRTAGEDKTKADIVRDYNYLIRSWNQIRLNALKNKAPVLIHEEGSLIKRALRDMYTKDISEIIVDGEDAYKEAREFTKILSPHNLKKIKVNKKGDLPLFQRFQVETQLDKLHDTNVQLESGGYLVINPTEALVSIDVNSGRATKEKDLEETALKTNLEAADEIAKQLRMRNLAGLVVVDFIDMDDPKNNIAVEKRMKEAMKSDRARVQIAKMSVFGLLEISRQRMHSSFFESNYQTCPHCQGKGLVRTMESSAVMVLRGIEEEGIRNRSSQVNVFVPSELAIFLLNQKRGKLSELELRYNMNIIISADDSIKIVSDYRIERTKINRQAAETSKQASVQPEILEEIEELQEDKPVETSVSTEENNVVAENFDGDNEVYHKKGRRYKDRRKRKSFGRERRVSNRHNNGAENNDGGVKAESKFEAPIILYNSHEDIKPTTENPNSSEEKGKTTWWRKLIKS